MSTAESYTPMQWSDVERTADAFKMGVLPMKAVAWQLHLYQTEHQKQADAKELSKLCDSTENAAHRALQSIRIYAAAEQRINDLPNRKETQLSEVTSRHLDESSSRQVVTPLPPDVSPPAPPSSFPSSPALSLAPPPACEEPPAEHVEATDPEPQPEPAPAIVPGGPDVEEVVGVIEDWSAGTLTFWARSACKSYPSRWVREVCERKLMGQRRQPPINVLNAVLRDWRAKGMSDDEAKRLDEPNPPPRLRATGTAGPAPADDDFSDLDDL